MSYEEMLAIAKRVAEQLEGQIVEHNPGEAIPIMVFDSLSGEDILVEVSLP